MRPLLGLAGLTTMLLLVASLPAGLAGQQSPASAPAGGSAAAGAPLYQLYCASCHGANLAPAESVFDLRYLAPRDKRRFVNSVARGKDSMPAWSALLTPQQIESVWDYVLSRNAEFAAAGSADPAASASQTWPCGGDARLLADAVGAPLWIASDELMSHGISMPPPALAGASALAGRLTVDVLIAAHGRVKCARVAPGSATPDAPPAVLDAIRKWTFRPFAAGGQPVAVFAHLELRFDPQ
jgi:mono/diheme cytochrome c family protein